MNAAPHRDGLGPAEAQRRLAEVGPNALPQEDGPSPLWILWSQLKSPPVLLLLAACGVSVALKESADAIAIAAIVLLNAGVGFAQEYRAERAMAALRSMTAPRARVRRGGQTLVISAAEVVPGDLLCLEAGDVVAADARLLEAQRLATNEAPLTGESAQVEKSITPVPAEAPLAERTDSVFMGTSVGTGTGLAEVAATGARTELGKIAHLLATTEDGETPLQQRLAKVSRLLLWLCLGIVGVVAAAGLVRGASGFDVFLSAVSLAVAAIPEGLPAIVTIALAIGVRRMAARHVLVRKLAAVETLGCATVICTDKTGTLTTGVMAVRGLWGPDEAALLRAAASCCDADLGQGGRPGVGDTTELAILAAAAERGLHRAELEAAAPREGTVPFDSQTRWMSVSRADGRLDAKGALEALLSMCPGADRDAAHAANADLAARGLRVLAVASGAAATPGDLRLLGLIGIADPPRKEAIAAVASAQAAGIETVMITGDHPLTAKAIAAELGIRHVHARAAPEDKLRIVGEWKKSGGVVAMTGDGVNDAPALRAADIGICMGKTGTDVTREASDMVLTDDNFASIVAAVREGRGIFDNIRKALVYLLSGNVAELAVMLVAALAGLPPPLLPLHLLWINLVTDGLPALALVMDPADPDVMRRGPRPGSEPMLGRPEWLRVIGPGLLEGTLALATFVLVLRTHGEGTARSMAFAVLVFTQLLRVFASRSPTRLFWEMGTFSNLTLLAVVGTSVAAQITLHALPWTRGLFRLEPLAADDWALALGLGFVPVSVLELLKLARRLRRPRPPAPAGPAA
jgi:P-type Ca2+ transporter type 2C